MTHRVADVLVVRLLSDDYLDVYLFDRRYVGRLLHPLASYHRHPQMMSEWG